MTPNLTLDLRRAMDLVPYAIEAVVAGELTGAEAYRIVEDEVQVLVGNPGPVERDVPL